jgi:hypothetical protein
MRHKLGSIGNFFAGLTASAKRGRMSDMATGLGNAEGARNFLEDSQAKKL